MMFKDFEISPVKSLDGVIERGRYELVKWYDHEPMEMTSMRTGEKKTTTRSCFVVAWLEYDNKDGFWDFKSVGLRLVENWVDGLDRFIVKWCEMAEVCMEDDDE